ncbi:MAG: heme ABC exporter ATP-binding protein CcmA, partial [Alphaproteobacteria bacterium]
MAGLLRLETGTIEWNGQDIAQDLQAHRSRVAYIGHQDALKPVLTVRENVAFWADLAGTTAGSVVDQALAAFGIGHLAELPARILSQGQRRRTNLARLVAVPAPLWLLDEPTVGLDTAAIAYLDTAIGAHRAKGGIVVAASHVAEITNGIDRLDLTSAAKAASSGAMAP